MPDNQPTRRFRLRFSLRQLFLVVALVAVVLGIWTWFSHKEVVIRAATPDDKVSERYFGLSEKSLKARNIAVATGTFTTNAWFLVSLHLVQGGTIGEFTQLAVHPNHNHVGGLIWTNLDIRLALGEKEVPGGRVTYLGTAGESRAGGYMGGVKHNIKILAKQTLPATITPGRPHIVYVEGDRAIVVDGKMTVEEFAKANPGNYLVVTVEVR